MNLLCCDHGISGLQIDINIVVDILIARCVKNIVKLFEIIKHSVLLEQPDGLLSRYGAMHLVVFDTEYDKKQFITYHMIRSSQIFDRNHPIISFQSYQIII